VQLGGDGLTLSTAAGGAAEVVYAGEDVVRIRFVQAAAAAKA